MAFINPLREKLLFIILFWGIRIGMGLTFVISGLRKLPGVEFTALPLDNPVGAFFYAMHETGFYWNFIGYFQIAIGLMLFVNRFAVVSSLLMMPVVINIFLVSVSLHMTGTPIITSFMLLGNIYLLLWYYENFLHLTQRPMYLQSGAKKTG